MSNHRQIRNYDVGRNLLTLRTRAGLTQAALAELLGLHRRTVQNWETSAGYPQEHGLQQLIAVYLARGVFTLGQEQQEAETLWQQVGEGASRAFAKFDTAWFARLAQPTRVPTIDSVHVFPTTLPPVRHNLPYMLTACIGREREVATIAGYLRDQEHRLITLVGMGGIGKTRLALEVVRRITQTPDTTLFRDGAYLVPLADVGAFAASGTNNVDAVATAIADALHFALSGPTRPSDQVFHFLRDQHVLLLLDNIEHLLNLAPTIVTLLQQTPALVILATSRAPLDVRGEHVVPIDGLPYPAAETPAPLESYPALQLFQRVAAAQKPHEQWSSDELAAAADVCVRVEGVPLAIELAASLTRLLSVQEIARELATTQTVLHASQRDFPPRHRSLQAVFDHSWRLLDPDEQHVLRQLSVFRGGFDRQAAYAVAGATLKSLAALINHSLLRETPATNAATRYNVHELVREYAAGKLPQSEAQGETTVAHRHSHYYLAWAAARLPALRDERQQDAQAEIHREIDNIRAAWHWAEEHNHVAELAATAGALFHFYEMRSWFQEGAEQFQRATDRCERLVASTHAAAATLPLAQMLARQGWLTFHVGQHEAAKALLNRSLALLETIDAPADRVFTLNYLAAVTYHTGNYAEAQHMAQHALDMSTGASNQYGMVIAKTILGQIAFLIGAYREAERWSRESLALEQSLGNRWGSVFTLISLGRVAMALQAYADARHWFEQGLAIREAMGDARGSGLCLTYLGDVAAATHDYHEAEQQYRASLSHFRTINNRVGVATALRKLGAVALVTDDRLGAQKLLFEALTTAWAIQAVPQTLDVLAGYATLLEEQEPARAGAIARVVAQHPAATQDSKHEATRVMQRLAPHDKDHHDTDPHHALVALVARLLPP